jgi:toxin ParE1/3/4
MRLRHSRYVRSDLDTIWDIVAEHGESVADTCLNKTEAVRPACGFPLFRPVHPDIGPDIRALVVERWLIVYRVASNCVDIIRIVDGARDLSRLDLPDDER